ncbi:hypothetical protein JF50_09310 [Pseudoalteromonas luteoviolacea]|uniref:Uncharacterized protein n=1 Tax=Pseudoalteromonas luteoviolacea TaxID=43657 RepID=A0A0C1MK19_9GAMM|nr:hypothetical protein [Pseudoalteromonas luteoviolacea]KID57394.1 hypothetical protein JF50_09310 [Pseudoalteromonas luteoviolacea]
MYLIYHPVMGRRLIANKLEKKLDFFRKANENYHFTKQEGGLLSLYFITAISFIVTFVEVNLFKFNLIGSVPFRLHIYGPSHLLISFFELFLVISMVLGKNRSSKEERHRFA